MKKALLIVTVVFGVLIGLLALSAATNALLNAIERAQHAAPGKLVQVDGLNLHVLARGTGSMNVVFLSGLGTPSPVDDFSKTAGLVEPVAKVTILEGFGYGWSDLTQTPREVGTIVDEYRAGLKAAGVLPPYVMVAHSISGIYVLSWIKSHPEEVAGLVGLDSTVAEQAASSPPPSGAELDTLLRNLGIVRIALALFPSLDPGATEQGRMVANWVLGNENIVDEMNHAQQNIATMVGYVPPSTLPITYILASSTVETISSMFPGLDWKAAHERLVAGNPRAKVVVMKGEHYIHRDNEVEVARLIRTLVTDLTISK